MLLKRERGGYGVLYFALLAIKKPGTAPDDLLELNDRFDLAETGFPDIR